MKVRTWNFFIKGLLVKRIKYPVFDHIDRRIVV